MGASFKSTKAPTALPTVNMLSGDSVFNGVTKATREAAKDRKENQYQTKEQRKAERLAARRAKYEPKAPAPAKPDTSDYRPAKTTAGAIKCGNNGMFAIVDGVEVALEGGRAEYPVKPATRVHTDRTGSAHHAIKRPVTFNHQLTIKAK